MENKSESSGFSASLVENIESFVKDFYSYIEQRFRQIFVFAYIFFLYLLELVSNLKSSLISKMFWGRGNLYRSSFHILMAIITFAAVLSGISSRLSILASDDIGLDISSGIIGRQDFLSQAGTAESITAIGELETDYKVYKHEVEDGESLGQIADFYQINPSSIRWANDMKDDNVNVGQILRIPQINGAFIKVKKGDTLELIAEKTNGTVADIVDLNSNTLGYDPDPELEVGTELFIPGGEIILPTPTPTKRPIVRAFVPPANNGTQVNPPSSPVVSVNPGSYVHPLLGCPGWSWSRGWATWHRGVDMAKRGGCWINSAGAGTVVTAKWGSYGEGYYVVIDHGGGVQTRYLHGNGTFAVKVGQQVAAGQNIMYMGTTGNSTGTHLHFDFMVNGARLNPEAYIKLR